MKDNIHPQYGYVVFRDRSTGKAFLTRSTLVAKAASLPTIEWEDGNTYSLVNVEVSSYSHPFYTGRNVVLDAAGQVQKFNKRYGPLLAGAGSRSETEDGRPTGAAHTSTLHKPISTA